MDRDVSFHDSDISPALLTFAEEINQNQLKRLVRLGLVDPELTDWDFKTDALYDPFLYLRNMYQRCEKVSDLYSKLVQAGIDCPQFRKQINAGNPSGLLKSSSGSIKEMCQNNPAVGDGLGYDEMTESGHSRVGNKVCINKYAKWLPDKALDDALNIPMAQERQGGGLAQATIQHIEQHLTDYWNQSPLNREKLKAIFIPAHGESDVIQNPADFIYHILDSGLTLDAFRKRCLIHQPFFNSFLYAASGLADEPLMGEIDRLAVCEFLDKTRKLSENKYAFIDIVGRFCDLLERNEGFEKNIQLIACELGINIYQECDPGLEIIFTELRVRGITIGELFDVLVKLLHHP